MSSLLKITPNGNFYIQEFIAPWWFRQAKSSAHILQGLRINNPAMIEGTQLIREHVEEGVTINNWHRGGVYSESCLRTPKPVAEQSFALFSTHMFWNTSDLKFTSTDIEDVTNLILCNPKEFNMITAIEDPNYTRSSRGKLGRDWLHVVFGYRPPHKQIKVFKP